MAVLSCCACGDDCSSADDCDPDECRVIRARQAGEDELRPVGCVEKGRDDAAAVVTYARDGAGNCWVFNSALLAQGFVEDRSCQAE
jgi:hypothetical protein